MTMHDGEEHHQFSGPHGSPAAHISLDEALSNNWLDIWYQPKIDLRRKCLAGAEALVRMNHPHEGLLWPADYQNGLDDSALLKLSEFAVITSMHHWEIFADAGFGMRLSVNVPANLLPQLPIRDLVAANCPRSEAWPGLILELTEDQIVRDLPTIRRIAGELKSAGVTISIDEFGAGYSSFASLRDLPFTELKLHASFVKNCATDETNAAICQTAIDLAHRFNSVVVAEGIASIADLQALTVMGCDLGQGMLLAPPLPKERFLDVLRQHMRRPRSSGYSPQNEAGRVA